MNSQLSKEYVVNMINFREKIEQALSETKDEPTQIDRIAEIRGWFRPNQNSDIYPAIQNYLNGSADLQTTVAKIAKPIDEAIKEGKTDDISLGYIWNSLLHSSKRIPFRDAEQHAKLVDLVKAIQEHPDPSGGSTYKTLSGLGMQAREAYNDIPRHDTGLFKQDFHAWANLNYFLARLTESGVFEFYLYTIWAMREALEKAPGRLPGWYDIHVPAAAVWVFALGSKLYEREEDLTPKNRNEGNPAKGGDLWTGGPVFSKERWAFWKKRFGDVAGEEGDASLVSEETRKIARDAVEAMEKAESA
ncbi:hypothetical protein BU23DRAFT_550203 [Bimuria novae-zelandiae CBS 107.79]|uniref:Uncharacterized protein n=1 Tax=Bimuria novae-zelandiae CBS 107.79 TaxID=1447943 RepID=A0A6A5VLC6_9PLEO|nr:hypothetical protein BU23DRAFT_550203 [Bimuria novae-zelandiae CBS 107.79]